MNLENHFNDLLFVPLGGANEIGINVNLYHYKGKWLMVDCGSGFADDYIPGVDMLVADISFIKKHKEDIVGLVLTHAHEDHLGAVQYLWKDLGCPKIYATQFTANFLKIRLSEYKVDAEVTIVEPKRPFNVGDFNVEMVSLTHSAPEMQALMIRTGAGNILHTGDWKFDNDPVIGPVSDEELLKKCGEEGVLAMVCDSTNVFTEGSSGSEGDLRKSLLKLVKDCPKLVVVTTFASNLARLDTIIHAAESVGRKVVLTGRSLHRMVQAAQDSGYSFNSDNFVDDKDVSKYNREDLLVIATGCQGEPLAALSKMINDTHSIKLAKGDTVIFSSKIIPGNDKRIFRMFNIFVRRGVEVITERDHFVHVSGHPAVEELRRMYELVKPVIAIPVHGEAVHLHEHCKLAKGFGIKHAVEVENGSVVRLDKLAPAVISKVQTGYFGIDGDCLVPTYSAIFKTRRKMMEAGVVVATVFIRDGRLQGRPVVSYPGCLDEQKDMRIINAISKQISIEIGKMQGRYTKSDIDGLIRSIIRRHLRNQIGKNPLIMVNVQDKNHNAELNERF